MLALTVTKRLSDIAPPYVAERIRLEMDELFSDPEEREGATCYRIGWTAPGLRYSKFLAFRRVCVRFGERPGLMTVSLFLSPILAICPLATALILFNTPRASLFDPYALVGASFPLVIGGLNILGCYLRVRYWLHHIIF